ncbi:MAG: ABC transporter ATP-binding protein/permease [Gammaproteobacteria bacterium]|nr:ABC transporter ATP-binding protein/permease [Gammaproteobacteria bacterium]
MLRDSPNSSVQLDSYLGVFRYGRRAIELVWSTDQRLTVALAVLTLTAGVLPAGIAYVGKLIVDSVVAAIAVSSAGGAPDYAGVMWFVAIEGLLVAGMAATQRGIGYCQTLLRVLLSQSVNTLILEKALTLELAQFEDSEFYDKLNRARQEASSRPLSLVTRTFNLLQHGISLASYATLLLQFSGWAVLVLIAAGLPAFIAETYFSGERFRMFRHRSAERRKLLYLEMVLAREDHAKEIKLFQLGTELLRRYKKIFQALFEDERRLTRRQDGWGLVLGLISNAAFYGAYAWIAVATIQGTISLGQMTMYLVVFKQGQSSVSAMLGAIGGLYEDNLYLSNLYEYLEQPTLAWAGASAHGPEPSAGVVFEHVSFTYPGASRPAVRDLSLTLTPGQSVGVVGRNGSGKTTLIKLLAGLYPVDEGRILYEGRNLEDWDAELLRKRIGIIFQDFNRYQLEVGENIGVGDEPRLHDAAGWAEAAQLGQAANFIEKLPEGYHTQLGRWFHQGQELSGGEWQRIALSRAFMRQGAEILVLDEPTAAMDAETEADVFEHFQSLTQAKIVVLISHRFSTVRQADLIVVMDQGQIIERGSHEELVALGGQYARLFELQARGYR